MSIDLGVHLSNEYTGVLQKAINTQERNSLGLEFGVATGHTLRMMSERLRCVGFDSFDGLPEDWRVGFKKGMFAQKIPDVPKAELVVGLFDEVMPQWIADNDERLQGLSLVHIDCDLYSSTKTVLELLNEYLVPGVDIVFDEYHGYPGWLEHEYKAWNEFVENNDVEYETIGYGPEQLWITIK